MRKTSIRYSRYKNTWSKHMYLYELLRVYDTLKKLKSCRIVLVLFRLSAFERNELLLLSNFYTVMQTERDILKSDQPLSSDYKWKSSDTILYICCIYTNWSNSHKPTAVHHVCYYYSEFLWAVFSMNKVLLKIHFNNFTLLHFKVIFELWSFIQ